MGGFLHGCGALCWRRFSAFFGPSPSGRQRFNVLGGLNAIMHEMITVTNDIYITDQSTFFTISSMA